ncbi:hypothetical protein [Microvirga yunnanensis]|uniref:hypothetical protein n=1 Tax=Microvirga yunnanensis TaxID=2953740 RepID=UPI0021C82E7B|nr:hypothetical protein [Microvirga sp. HBU65207]
MAPSRFNPDIKPIPNCFVTENISVPVENIEIGTGARKAARGAHEILSSCFHWRGITSLLFLAVPHF